jgi:myo-inositol-1-phosphate synthase
VKNPPKSLKLRESWASAGRNGGCQHDHDRGRARDSPRPRQANWIAHADGTVRLGKRTEGRSPQIKDFVPLASLDDVVFGGWDIFEDNAYEAAKTAGVIDTALLDQIKPELEAIKPMSAVFDRKYVKRLDGPNVKRGGQQARAGRSAARRHPPFQGGEPVRSAGLDLVRSTEVYLTESESHASLAAFEKALEATIPRFRRA